MNRPTLAEGFRAAVCAAWTPPQLDSLDVLVVQIGCGTMSLAVLEALTAGVEVRCELIGRSAWPPGRQGLLAQRGRHRPQVGVGLMDYVDAENEARKARRGDVARAPSSNPGVAGIVTAAHPGIHALGSGRDATAADGSATIQMIGLDQEREAGPAVFGRVEQIWRGQYPGPAE